MSLIRPGKVIESPLLFRIALGIMIILGILSYAWADIRLYGDAADYLFRMVNENGFFIIHSRPASIFIEWLPVLLIKSGASMNLVIKALSMTEWLWMFGNFLFFAYILRSKNHAIALSLVYLFGIRWNYFNPVSELLLAFPLFILMHFLWSEIDRRNLLMNLLLSWTIGIFLFFSHPLYIIALPVLLCWQWIQSKWRKDYVWIGIGLLLLVALRYFYLDSYEKDPLSKMHLSLNPKQMLKRFVAIGTILELGKCYAGLAFLTIAGSVALWKNKLKLHFTLLLGFVLGFLVLVFHKFGGLYPETFEPFERYLFIIPLTVVTALIPVWSTWQGWKRGLLILMMAWHAFYLFRYSRIVSNRYEVFHNAFENTENFEENKILYRKENYYPEFLSNRINGQDWIMPSESLLLTSVDGPEKTKQVFIRDIFPDDYYQGLPEDEFIYYIQPWTEKLGNMNFTYMRMAPSAWKCANTDSMQVFTADEMQKVSLKIEGNPSFKLNEKTELNVQIDNTSDRTIYSGMRIQRIGIGYRWISTESKQAFEGRFLSPFMADLKTHLHQRVIIVGPEAAGEYQLEIGYQNTETFEFLPFSGDFPKVEFD